MTVISSPRTVLEMISEVRLLRRLLPEDRPLMYMLRMPHEGPGPSKMILCSPTQEEDEVIAEFNNKGYLHAIVTSCHKAEFLADILEKLIEKYGEDEIESINTEIIKERVKKYEDRNKEGQEGK